MLEVSITKITGNNIPVKHELYAIELYYNNCDKYSELLVYCRDFFKLHQSNSIYDVFNSECNVYLYLGNLDIKNKFISYLTEVVFSDKFNFLLDIKESNKLRIVYSISEDTN